MKQLKRIFLAIVTLALGLTLVSCKNKDARNEHVPYGSLTSDTVVAKNDAYSLDAKTYYDLLRSKSYDTFVNELKYELFKNEITAIKNLLDNNLSDTDKAALSYTGNAADADVEYLSQKYNKLVGTSLASSIYGTYSLTAINNKTEKDIKLSVEKYIKNQARKGITVNEAALAYAEDTELNIITVSYKNLPEEIYKEAILSQAQSLYTEKELYKIAGQPTIESVNEDGETVDVKNSYQVFTEAQYKSTYESTLKTYGTYKAVVIQFNSYKEAKRAVSNVEASITNPTAFYLELYNEQYKYKQVESLDDAAFTYKVNENVNELNKISSAAYTLVTQTLEDGEFLTEPRNINNKYVMAYRLSTEFKYEQDVEEINFDTFEKLNVLKRTIVENNASSYATQALNKLIESKDIKIFDPFLEYKFEYQYPTQYDTIEVNKKDPKNNTILFSVDGVEYTVDKFFELISKTAGQSVILEYFQLQYASQLVDKYVTEKTQKTNKETLDAAIKAFKDGENTTYPAEIGKETFLFANYGYISEEDVIKYYYNASSALSSYKDEIVNEKWAVKDTNEISDVAKNLISLLLQSGSNYQDIFSLDLDHILINIDDNNDGNPDNPKDFLAKYPNVAEDFKKSVEKLAQAIYAESKYLVTKGNTTFEAFQYIVKQYNKGADLHTDVAPFAGTMWDNYKTYNFLLTAEQLASSSDITQETVSNFVVPFADYVKDIAKSYSNSRDVDYDNGQVIIVKDHKAIKVDVDKNAEDEVYSVNDITYDTLCETSFGYHLLSINEYNETEDLETTSTANNSKYYEHFYKIYDAEDENDDIYVTVNTENSNKNTATVGQLFVYLTQKELNVTSTLNTDIAEVLGALYNETINTYVGTNFQTLVLIDTLNISSDNEAYQKMITNERAYYVDLVTNYGEKTQFATWCADTTVFRNIK
jgi:hypothetical protein